MCIRDSSQPLQKADKPGVDLQDIFAEIPVSVLKLKRDVYKRQS